MHTASTPAAVHEFLQAVRDVEVARDAAQRAQQALAAAEAVAVRRMRRARNSGAQMAHLAKLSGLSRPALYRLDAKFTDIELDAFEQRRHDARVIAY